MVEIFGHVYEHIAEARPIGNPPYVYVVRTESGYYIRKASMDEGVYKTATSIYETDNPEDIIIIPASELPEDAVLMGGETQPETETI